MNVGGRGFAIRYDPRPPRDEEDEMTFPICPSCRLNGGTGARVEHMMVPLSDFANEGSSVEYKAWACINPKCKYVVKITKGNVEYTRGKVMEP